MEKEVLRVNEIYLSLQGESTFAGLPCIFIRTTGCNLRCSYCDTAYAFVEGRTMTFLEIDDRIKALTKPYLKQSAKIRLPLIELTGGEPLVQKNSIDYMSRLCDQGFTVLVETSGALDISPVDPRVRRIMDIKCPSSGEADKNHWPNLRQLTSLDEVKFVIGTRQDYDWAVQLIREKDLALICPLLFSWSAPLSEQQQNPALKKVPPGHRPISRKQLVEAIIADALPVRFQVQLHKVIWSPETRGV